MSLDKYLKDQRAALENGDTAKALKLLDDIEQEIDKTRARTRLRENEPKSYEQLIERLDWAAEELTPDPRCTLKQLAYVFGWCKQHDIPLSTFVLPEHLGKYREAASVLKAIVSDGAEDSEIERKLLAAIETIKGHRYREDTRDWAHMKRPKRDAAPEASDTEDRSP